MISEICFILISYKTVDKNLVAPNPTIQSSARFKSSFETSANAFTAVLKKKGLATAKLLENNRRADDE